MPRCASGLSARTSVLRIVFGGAGGGWGGLWSLLICRVRVRCWRRRIVPTSDGRFRGISVPRLPWVEDERDERERHNDRMLEKAAELARLHPDAQVFIPVHKRKPREDR